MEVSHHLRHGCMFQNCGKRPPVGIVKQCCVSHIVKSSGSSFIESMFMHSRYNQYNNYYMLPVFRQISLVSESMDFAILRQQKFKQCDKAQY